MMERLELLDRGRPSTEPIEREPVQLAQGSNRARPRPSHAGSARAVITVALKSLRCLGQARSQAARLLAPVRPTRARRRRADGRPSPSWAAACAPGVLLGARRGRRRTLRARLTACAAGRAIRGADATAARRPAARPCRHDLLGVDLDHALRLPPLVVARLAACSLDRPSPDLRRRAVLGARVLLVLAEDSRAPARHAAPAPPLGLGRHPLPGPRRRRRGPTPPGARTASARPACRSDRSRTPFGRPVPSSRPRWAGRGGWSLRRGWSGCRSDSGRPDRLARRPIGSAGRVGSRWCPTRAAAVRRFGFLASGFQSRSPASAELAPRPSPPTGHPRGGSARAARVGRVASTGNPRLAAADRPAAGGRPELEPSPSTQRAGGAGRSCPPRSGRGGGMRARQWPGSGVLLSQGLPQVPSALAGLTSVFGMGTGVTPPLWPPETCCL